MAKHHDIKKRIDEARALYLRFREKGDSLSADEAAGLVRQLQSDWAAELAKGANPCPFCGQPPHGIEHPKKGGGFEYEVGCLVCKPFEHSDGTMRWVRCRGGLIPKQTVEAWNEGPDYWLMYLPR